MRTFECQTSIPEVDGLESGKLTVGRHILASCKGETGDSFDFHKATVKADAKNFIRIFSLDSSSTDAFKMDFTLYKTGEVKLSDFVLTDGTNEIVLNSSPLKVESVLKPTQDGKPPEPFGPLLPISISTPVSYYFYAVGLVFVVVLYFVLKAKRLNYYRKLKNKLSQYNSPVDPESQFYRAIRSAEKQGYPLQDLEKAFRLYSLRAYRLPLFDLPNERAIRYFKRNYPEHKEARLHLHKILNEFESLKQAPEPDQEKKNDLIKKLYRFVDNNKGLPHE
jgi:hypothetical protein